MSTPHTWPSLGQSRAIVYTVLVLLSIICLSPERAAAQAAQCQTSAACDQGQAYAAAIALANSEGARICKMVGGNNATYTGPRVTLRQAGTYEAGVNCSAGSNTSNAGSTYFSSSCASRADGQAGMINGTLYSGGVCDNGCKVAPNLDPGTNFSLKENGNPNAISIRSGTWKATGGVCSPTEGDQKPEKKDEFCHTTSSGHTVCKSKDKTCVSTSSGFRTCASDTANKTGHTATNTSRTEGIGIGAPDTPPNPPSNRPGEDWQPSTGGSGGSSGGSSVTNNNTGSTTNNNTYNNVGKPNGNQTVPGDGSGPGQGGSNGGAEGEGEGDGGTEHGTVGGDGQCGGSFTCTGGDPVLCSIAQQTYQARCEAEGRWGEGEGAGQFPGDGDGGAGEDPDPKSAVKSAMPRLSMLDESGFFGGGSCPQIPSVNTRWGSFDFNNNDFCKVIGIARGALILLGAFIALGILMGWQGRD